MRLPVLRGLRAPIISARTAVIATAVVAVVLAVLVTCSIVWWRAADDRHAIDDNRQAVRATAGQIVAQVFSVDRDSWQADRARARELVGGEFASRNATLLTRPPDAALRAVRWTPVAVAVTDAGAGHVDTLVRASVVSTPASGAPVTEKRSVTARFDLIDDRWKLTRMEVMA